MRFKAGLVVSALLFVIGVVCWVLQLTQGLQLTNMNNYNTWGLYIVGFVLFTGVGAGSLLFASCACLFESFSAFKPYARIASFVGAIGSVIAAGLFIIVDIGNPQRVWYMITSMNITSPIVWDALTLGCYVVIGIIFTRQLVLVHQGKNDKSLRSISVIAFVAGILVTVTSFVFSAQVARPSWNNPGQPLSFLMAAVAVAICMLMLVYAALNKSRYISMEDKTLSSMGKLAAVFLGGELIFVLAEVAIGLYAGAGEDYKIVRWLVAGEGAVFFYVELCALVLGMILLIAGKKSSGLITGAVVGFFAVFMVKYNMIQSQLMNPLISYAGPAATTNPGGVYLPAPIELGVSIGIVGLGALLVILGLNALNLGDPTNLGDTAKQKPVVNT